jgi:hypothetical protein
MALNVRYHDGRMQAVPADKYGSLGDYWRFTREDAEVALIAKKSVESITTGDVPAPAKPAPKFTAV